MGLDLHLQQPTYMMMKPIFYSSLLLCLSLLTSSCSEKNETNDSQFLGTWKLTSYSVGLALDINKDGEKNLNLLTELNCDTNEILKFENTGVVSSTNTFQHEIKIFIKEANLENYGVEVECAEGAIGFASTYEQTGENSVMFNTIEATVDGNQLSRTITDGISIYNEDLTEVVETKSVTLIYSKQ